MSSLFSCPKERIDLDTVVLHKAYFDLWGLSMGWIDTIQDRIMSLACDINLECTSSTCPANMSVWVESENRKDVDKAIKLFKQLYNLAKKTETECCYIPH